MRSMLLFSLMVSGASAATITTSTSAMTRPAFGSLAPDCSASDPLSSTCNMNGAGATATADGWFDEQHSQGGIKLATFADSFAGNEQAVATATASVDIWFSPVASGTIRAVFSYGLGPTWGWPPTLRILLNGVERDFSTAGSGEVSMLTQVELGTPFEVKITLDGRASAPDGNGSGTAQLYQFFQEMDVMSDTMPRQSEKQVFLADPPGPSTNRTPEPTTLAMAALGIIFVASRSGWKPSWKKR